MMDKKNILGIFKDNNNQYGSAYLGNKRYDSEQNQTVVSPITGKIIYKISFADKTQIDEIIKASKESYQKWIKVPAPKRGELIRLFAVHLRRNKKELAAIITTECGKPWQESLGEVQELIDVCDFSVGLSRQLYGLTITTERTNHRMMEQWHPIGPVLIISAFNFPMAVWGWNMALAIVCGNSIIWKPSSQCPLSALACHRFLLEAIKEFEGDENLSSIIFGEKTQVETLCDHKHIALVSATGSCGMGCAVGVRVANRMGRTLLELGGNNAIIVSPSADLALAIRAIVFSALGTSGQRCTSLRRLIVHKSIEQKIITQLKKIYLSVKIGDPFDEQNLMGPLINENIVVTMIESIKQALQQKGELLFGGEKITTLSEKLGGFYVTPTLVKINFKAPIVQKETFAPLLYIHSYSNIDEAIMINNSVDQGLSSAIFTKNVNEAELFLSACGSDCGIVNVNIGTSGAEIGGAFGGEKDTGGGRESGSDAWKNYMRRCTNTINYGSDLPLAQGITFDIDL
jgi:aldehyde dehydrogenase (NAD+)